MAGFLLGFVMETERRKSTLTPEDREAIAEQIWEKMKHELYLNAGKGVVNSMIRLGVLGVFALAAFGYAKGWFSL